MFLDYEAVLSVASCFTTVGTRRRSEFKGKEHPVMSEAQAGNGKPQGPDEQSPEAASPLLDHISELAAAFLNGSSWEEAKNQFRLLYKPIFQGVKKDEGYTLLHHRAFVDFQRLFESTLKQRLDMLGVTEEQFLQQLESGAAPEDEAIRVIFDTVRYFIVARALLV